GSAIPDTQSKIRVWTQDETVVFLQANLVDQVANKRLFDDTISRYILRQKGNLDMASEEPRMHQLARAANDYVQAHQGQLPRGTADRPAASSRAGRPYHPDERVSFLAELVPFFYGDEIVNKLGHKDAPNQINVPKVNRAKSWRDRENVLAASTLIPQFLDP